MNAWNIRPKHWYQWINPFWWRTRKRVIAILNYEWERNGMNTKVEKAMVDAIIYGEGSVSIDWNDK